MNFSGKTALVTGASRGIGREIAILLAAQGARVFLVARTATDLEETKRIIGKSDTRIFPTDLRDENAIEQLARSVHGDVGEIDILINAAGVWHDGQKKYHGPRLAETPTEQIHEVLEVGLRAAILLNRLFLPGMTRKKSGKILHIACGFSGPHEAVGWLHYYVTNKAIEALTAGLAAEVRDVQVQVNCIAPWFVASEAVARFFPAESKTALPLREVAQLASFLVSREADHISGQTIELRSKSDGKP